MLERFCESHIELEEDVLHCRELSTPEKRCKCPYEIKNIQLTYVNGNLQLYIPCSKNKPACHDFVPTHEVNSELIKKLAVI